MFKAAIGVKASNNCLVMFKGNRACGPKIKTQHFPDEGQKLQYHYPEFYRRPSHLADEKRNDCYCCCHRDFGVLQKWSPHPLKLRGILQFILIDSGPDFKACWSLFKHWFSRPGQNTKRYSQKVLPKPTSKQLNADYFIIIVITHITIIIIMIINTTMNIQWIFCKYPISTCTRRNVAENEHIFSGFSKFLAVQISSMSVPGIKELISSMQNHIVCLI